MIAEKIDGSIRETHILQIDNYRKWNWDLILALLKVSERDKDAAHEIYYCFNRIFRSKQIRRRAICTNCKRNRRRMFDMIRIWLCSFRFLDKLCDFFKPEQNNGFNDIALIDPLSDVTCRALLAFSDLLVYPPQAASNHIRVKCS